MEIGWEQVLLQPSTENTAHSKKLESLHGALARKRGMSGGPFANPVTCQTTYRHTQIKFTKIKAGPGSKIGLVKIARRASGRLASRITMRADAMLDKGDLNGCVVWKRIVRAVKEIQRKERHSKEPLH